MRQLLLAVIVAALVPGLAGALAGAEKEPLSIEPVSIQAAPLDFGSHGQLQACQMGNLNTPAWSITNFIYPPEEYMFAFDPLATCSVCSYEFGINTIHVFLQAKATCRVTLLVRVAEAAYPSPGCTAPGNVLCSSSLYEVNLTVGLWNIAIPITCDCLASGNKYLLGVRFQSRTCTAANLGLILDAGPAVYCRNWNDYGAGWADLLVDYPTWPGQLLFYADAECCEPPVSVESRSWGAIKQLFEN